MKEVSGFYGDSQCTGSVMTEDGELWGSLEMVWNEGVGLPIIYGCLPLRPYEVPVLFLKIFIRCMQYH